MLLHDDRNGDKRATTIEGQFGDDLMNPKIIAGKIMNTRTVDANLSPFFNSVGKGSDINNCFRFYNCRKFRNFGNVIENVIRKCYTVCAGKTSSFRKK